MAEETKKKPTAKPKTTTKKKPATTATKKPTTTKKKATTSTTKKPSSTTTKKVSGTTTKKPSSKTTKKTTTTTKKKTTSTSSNLKTDTKKVTKTSPKSSSTTKKASSSKTSKTTPKEVKSDNKTVKTAPKAVKKEKTTKKPAVKKTRKPKAVGRLKSNDELTTFEEIEQKVEGKVIREKVKKGKVFYLLFAIIFYTGAFFYINEVVYNNADLLQSALFAFAAVFVVFVLLLFNVHMIFINFFLLPFKRLLNQSRQEIRKEIEFQVGKNKMQTAFNKYRAMFTLALYVLISGLILYSIISGGILDNFKVITIVTQAVIGELIFLLIVCSWQYLFNIIPSLLDKSIDAKNGFILTLSATVIVIYIIFMIFEITYLSELMIFILIIGFIALLGVNLNMIVGEINIFQNLRQKKSKAVTRIVFIIFFGFHVYVILYASVVAFSIYNWDNNAYIFSNEVYDKTFITETYEEDGDRVTDLYTQTGVVIDVVYDDTGAIVTDFFDIYDEPITTVYDDLGNPILGFYRNTGQMIDWVYTEEGIQLYEYFYHEGTVAGYAMVPIEKTYGDFLYYAVVTISSVGYGDVSPSIEHDIAKFWGGFLSIYGLTFYALSIGFVSNIAMEGIAVNRKED
jgi:hypothetical protein